ncbi:gephyrin-like molybdotransferase Glp [Epilithonimonas sp. UC225_85]|uniref:molybdopterin molybdotransferase MoeA n=1 Tax=Epilithonimonas sp. UC225_85 TaxID=3350167 RepID=UPI0036D3BDAE
MKTFISVSEAKNIIKEKVFSLPISRMKLLDAVGFTLAEDVFAFCDIPAYNQSSVDGYAFRFKDNEQVFKVVGEMAAGTNVQLELSTKEAARIFTGAPLSNGADTVIMQEYTEIKDGKLFLKDENIDKGKNVRLQGAEIQKGALAMKKGTHLSVAAVGFLAGIGITEVSIFAPPKVAIILTGNELQKPGLPLNFGQVYEANSFILVSALKQMGIKNIEVLKAEDNLYILQTTLENALKNNDVVLLTGGVSVGDYDFVVQAVENCNIEAHFHKIKQRPGKPLLFSMKENKAVFGLPGNPSSGLVCFYEYVLPFIENMMHKKQSLNKISAVLTHNYEKTKGLTHFLKGHYEDGKVTPLHAQESFRLHSFSQANCLIVLEEDKTHCLINETVELHLLPF